MIEQTGYNNHIWDNVLSKLSNKPSSKKQQRKICLNSGPPQSSIGCISPSTTVDIVEIERKIEVRREEFHEVPKMPTQQPYRKCLDTSATPFFCTTNVQNLNTRPKYGKEPKQQGNQCMATDQERKNAPQPKNLANWKYTPNVDNITYDARAASDAFQEYAMRMRAKRLQRETRKEPEYEEKANRKRDIHAQNLEGTRIGKRQSEPKQRTGRLEKTVQMTNVRDDEVSIVKYEKRADEEMTSDDLLPPTKNRKPLAFYGTIEAQTCASHAAEQISKACENLKRLQFVAEEAYPNGATHLKTLDEIGNEIRDFNAQVRSHRAIVPKNMSMNSGHVAHFVLE